MARTIQTAASMARFSAPPPPLHSLIATLSGLINPQPTSVLFSTIPPEIRNRIFSFALYSYGNLSRPYPQNSYYSRPGYQHHQLISTALLATCRRIYTETHDLPVSQNEHIFWCYANRGPVRDIRRSDDARWYFHKLTVEQRAAVKEVHLFTQLCWLQSYAFKTFCKLEDVHPQHLKITIRHTDWWYWELNTPLAMKSQWADNLMFMQKLNIFDLELETMERDKDQLETIAGNMVEMRLVLADSRSLSTRGSTITRDRYLGQSVYDLGEAVDDNSIYYSQPDDRWITGKPLQTPDQIPYVISTIRWTETRPT